MASQHEPNTHSGSGLSTRSIDQRKLIGQAIIDGVLNPKHAALLGSNADYSQNGGNYTQKSGDYRQNGGGNYNQSKEMLPQFNELTNPAIAAISEIIAKAQFRG